MGGALRAAGNVLPGRPETPSERADGSAEWNAYWDPAAMGVLWGPLGRDVPLTLVPLDATNQVCMYVPAASIIKVVLTVLIR